MIGCDHAQRIRLNVHALFDAAFRQQLQGPPCAGAARHSLQAGRDRHPARAKAARRNSSPRIRAARCRCWKSRPTAISPNSNAILWYVAGGTRLAPEDRIERAEALQWMFFEQHSLEPNIGAAYFWLALIKGGRELQSHALEDWMENGYRALGVMEMHLAKHRFFVAGHFTVADIALYAYTHVAEQCDFDLVALSGGARLARARGGRARLCADGLAARAARCRAIAFVNLSLTRITKTPRFFTGGAAIGPNRCRFRRSRGGISDSFDVRNPPCASPSTKPASRRPAAARSAASGAPSPSPNW